MSCLQNFILMALFTFLSPKLFAMNDCIESSLQLPITTYQIKNICNVVVKNDICQNLKTEDRLRCDVLDHNPQINLWGFLKGCTHGIFDSSKSFLSFMWEILKWSGQYFASSDFRNEEMNQEIEYFNITKLYLHTEFEKAYDREKPPFQDIKALMTMGNSISNIVLGRITNMMMEKFQEFECANFEAKSKMTCQFIGTIFIPPDAALALIKNGTRAFKTFPNLKTAFAKLGDNFLQVRNSNSSQFRLHQFRQWLKGHLDSVWSSSLDPKTREAIKIFNKKGILKSGQVYGGSVASLQIGEKSAGELDKYLLSKGFIKHHDVIHDPVTHLPKLDPSGNKIVMDVYTHSDGGMVRVKPHGDPGSPFRPQPHAVKAVRYPPDSAYDRFENEAFKVDEAGLALPKWSKDFDNRYPDIKNILNDWADDIHIDLILSPI